MTTFFILLFDFIFHIFFSQHFIASVKKLWQNSVVPADGAHTKVDFLERLHKMLREKRCDK